mmetsp:Transcript_123095/g.245043  ORF Transcript_123095/g.245043 Transcript_123095/m.245043 type:complete len:241 (-) Transcript_123095:1582-2304(-)
MFFRILGAREVGLESFKRVESDIRRFARCRLLATGRLTEQVVFIDSRDIQFLHALVNELVLAPRSCEHINALRQAGQVGSYSPPRKHLDGTVEAPLAVVQIHGRILRHVTDEVVTNASTILRRGPGNFVESFSACMVPALIVSNTLRTALMRPALRFAACAFEVLRHWPLDLYRVHRGSSLKHCAQSFCKENCIWVDLDSPVIAAVDTNPNHFSPESVENACVQSCAPPATVNHRKRAVH